MATRQSILIVDDDETLGRMLGTQLSDEGYNVHYARDGRVAMEVLSRQCFHLAILDITMPGIDGFGVLEFVKQKCPSTKAIMLTGHGDLKHALESKRRGADDFVEKPYDLADLVLNIHRILDGEDILTAMKRTARI